VWLEVKNLSLPYGSVKLAPRRHGPFQITQVISPVAYKLHLPPQWTIHLVFHASLLTPFVETKEHGENYLRPPPELMEGGEQYEVEAIKSHRRHGRSRQLQYLIKWKGYPESDNTWEPVTNLQAPQLIKEYHRRHPLDSIKLARFVADVEARDREASPQSVQYVPHSPTPSVQEVSPPPLHVRVNPPNEGYAPLSPGSAQTLIRLSEEEFSEVARTVALGLAATVERRTNIAAQQITEA
jgi:hypothetical protein